MCARELEAPARSDVSDEYRMKFSIATGVTSSAFEHFINDYYDQSISLSVLRSDI